MSIVKLGHFSTVSTTTGVIPFITAVLAHNNAACPSRHRHYSGIFQTGPVIGLAIRCRIPVIDRTEAIESRVEPNPPVAILASTGRLSAPTSTC